MSPQEIQQGRDAYTAAQADQPNAARRITTAQLALSALDSAKVGGGTESLQAINNVLGSYSPDFIKKIIPDFDPAKAATDYQLAAKYMQQITNAGGGLPGGASTSDKLNAAAAATPNPHMQDMASKDVLKVLVAQERLGQYVLSEFNKTGLPPAQFQKWSAEWARTHDPRAFMLPDMDAGQRAFLKKTMPVGSKDRQTFQDTTSELIKNGAIPPPPSKSTE